MSVRYLGQRDREPLLARWLRKVRLPHDQCWLWGGAKAWNGYGKLRGPGHTGPMLMPHRLAYETFRGPIPEGKHLHHTCGHKWCVNPAHLEAVTPGEHGAAHMCPKGHVARPGADCVQCQQGWNRRRAIARRWRQQHMNRCGRGHQLTPDNVRFVPKKQNGKVYRFRACWQCWDLMKRRARKNILREVGAHTSHAIP